jgi:hypothetical protein
MCAELSIVAEGDLGEEAEEVERIEENAERPTAFHAQSPGAMSQMSGTTAITTMTSRSEAAIAELDDFLAEDLLELYSWSRKIVNLLAEPGTSKETLKKLITELKTSGSKKANTLRRDEQSFKLYYDRFVFKGETYIRIHDILRKLLGKDYGEGDFRPDAIMHLANLATMVKDFLVTERKSQHMKNLQFFLNRWFPEAFVNKFRDRPKYGDSALFDKSFDLALDIRTQFAISELQNGTDSGGWDPERILAEIFYDSNNENPKSIMGNDIKNTPKQVKSILKRMDKIRSAFRDGKQAQEHEDLVDLEHLQDRLFPWSAFLTNLVLWTRLRTDEILTCIKAQGSLDGIQKALSEVMRINGNQESTEGAASTIPQAPLLPAAEITQGASSKR